MGNWEQVGLKATLECIRRSHTTL